MHILAHPVFRWLSGLLLALGMTSCTLGNGGGGGVQHGSTFYDSGGKRIKVETFLPAGQGRHAAVLVLYGSGGALLGKSEMTDFARKLAANGFAAFLVHYFNRTGTVAVASDGPITQNWPVWDATVRDGIGFVAQHPRVRPGSLGMFGYSLGGFLSVSAGVRDSRIRAVAEVAGGVFDALRGRAGRFPPTLALHGRQDERVSVAQVQTLQREAARFGVEPEVKIYEGEGHRLSPAALADASGRSLQFLRRHLDP